MSDYLNQYKKKVTSSLGTSEPQEDLNISTGSKDLNLYKSKVKFAGLTADQSMNDNLAQYRSLLSALHHSYNTEKIRFVIDPINLDDDVEYLALIEKGKETFSEDDEYIGMDFNDAPIAVGKTIDWIRTGFKYLVMDQDLSTRAYFSGRIRRANYLIKWTDDNFNIYQQWAIIEGPSESEAAFKGKGDIVSDTGQNVISMYLGKTDATQFLKRYNRIIIKDSDEIDTASQSKVKVRAWRIDVVDDISNKFIVKISLKENFINQSELTDSEVYALTFNGLDHSYEFDVPLSPNMATGYVLNKENISLYKNGQLLNVDPDAYNVYVNGALVNDLQPFNVAGDYFIKITANGYPEDASYGQTITFSNVGATIVYEIRGSDRIKPYKTYTYQSKAIANGQHTSTSGTWAFSNPKVISGYTTSGDAVSFVAKDILGDFYLSFTDVNGTVGKTLTIISMLLEQ